MKYTIAYWLAGFVFMLDRFNCRRLRYHSWADGRCRICGKGTFE